MHNKNVLFLAVLSASILFLGAGCAANKQPEAASPSVSSEEAAPQAVNPEEVIPPVSVALDYQTVAVTSELINKYANKSDWIDTISSVPEKLSKASFDLIKQPVINNLFQSLVKSDKVEIENAFGVSSGAFSYLHNNMKDAVVFKGCMPHDCSSESATAIYIANYQDDSHQTPKDELFLAFQVGNEIRLYNVSEPGKSDVKDALLYFHLSDWNKIK